MKNQLLKCTTFGFKTFIQGTFIVLASIMSFQSYSQPTLQSADLHTGIGFDVYALNNVTPANLTSSGANVTWDLSSATVGTLQAHVDFMDMASTGYASAYPTANFAMKFTSGGTSMYNFWRTTSTIWEEVAINVGSSGLQTFNNNRTDLVFPYTFNLADTDTYQKNGQSTNTVIHTYDAYGTVTLSTGNITNLVRDYSTDNGTGGTQAIWWQTSPIAPVIVANSSGITLWQLANPAGINETGNGVSFHVYPNPADNELHIVNEKPIDRIEIFDMAGRSQIEASRSVIDISGLSAGIYVIKAIAGERTETVKFVKR